MLEELRLGALQWLVLEDAQLCFNSISEHPQ